MLSARGRLFLEYLFWFIAALCLLPLLIVNLPRPTLAAQTQALILTTETEAKREQIELIDPIKTTSIQQVDRVALPDSWKAPVMQDWSAKRREHFVNWLTGSPTPIAVLEFPGTGGQVAVFAEETERAMTLGASYLDGLQNISEDTGNLALASHRDGPFRQLKHVGVGDEINLYAPEGMQRYRVRQTRIVLPGEVSVLDDNGEHRLTLITCYPFYFVGSAPERFIVEAIALHEQRLVPSISATTTIR